ncbi:hypothetical protein AMR41_28305 [Hapalosiphon sp. MRB220]|nr:hypothetical protein AMR41_28305 [Hapalosiphon sp. MRB220]
MELLTGLVGVLLGAFLTAFFTRRESKRQAKINTTLKMYERFQSILSSRIIADQLLDKNFALEHPLTYQQLKTSLSLEDWQHISTTRHFFNELGLLYKTGYLDTRLARVLFAPTFKYWYEKYFLPLEVNPVIKDAEPIKWIVSPNEIASWLLNDTVDKSRLRPHK